MNTKHATPSNPRGLKDIPFKLPEVAPSAKRRARRIYAALAERYPDARCALDYATPHELLVATMLSAQCTDVAVNKATPGLFKAFPTPADYAAATPDAIEPKLRTLNFFRNKAIALQSAMQSLVDEHSGEVPTTMEELTALRGVARKTANVVLGNAFNINHGVVVDTHVHRLARRFGLAPKDATIPATEKLLMAIFPRTSWTQLSHLLIFHGRAVCKARHAMCAEDAICRAYCANARA